MIIPDPKKCTGLGFLFGAPVWIEATDPDLVEKAILRLGEMDDAYQKAQKFSIGQDFKPRT